MLLGALVALLVGCGGPSDGRATFVQAQDGLTRIRSGTIEMRATVHTPISLERSAELRADEVPLSKLELTRWTKHPRRIACAADLDCARAEVDVKAALQALDPFLPSPPVDPGSIRSAQVDVAVAKSDGLPRRLRLRGKLDSGGLFPGTVPFEVDLDLKHPRAG